MLKTSLIKKGIRDGTYSGWSDIRLQTLLAMKRRGYRPEAFRKYWVNSGMREIDSEFSWEIFNSINKEIVDPLAKRLWFVPDPVRFRIAGGGDMNSKAPFHPGNPDEGERVYHLGAEPEVYIPGKDWITIADNEKFRLKDLCNVTRKDNGIVYADNSHEDLKKIRILQWSPADSPDFSVERPDGTVDNGTIEPLLSKVKGVSQFERYGYVNLDPERKRGYFLHK
ncbi:glutamyl-tRNA synthetase [mine drainage metagenome]|uniref:Glutamyl-tRNA synthetase n=1 Tax=mine drainage metagenome TaxID=410659 RepID=T0YVH2_9ZZZZ